MNRFHLVDPEELESFDEWAAWLEALLHNPCAVFERDGELILLETKQLVARVNGLRLEIYSREHPPPHFHVVAPDIDATFAIDDCRQLNGTISPSAARKVRYWHGYSKPKLIEVWNGTRPSGCTVGPYTDS
jgi:hypothetical protein